LVYSLNICTALHNHEICRKTSYDYNLQRFISRRIIIGFQRQNLSFTFNNIQKQFLIIRLITSQKERKLEEKYSRLICSNYLLQKNISFILFLKRGKKRERERERERETERDRRLKNSSAL